MFRLKKIELFTSIDEMPVYNWFKIHQTNDLTLLVKSGKSETKKHSELLIATWDSLLSEFIDTFGVSETFKKIIRLRFSIETKKFQVIHTGDKSANTFIKLEQIELDKLTRHEPKKHLQDIFPWLKSDFQ